MKISRKIYGRGRFACLTDLRGFKLSASLILSPMWQLMARISEMQSMCGDNTNAVLDDGRIWLRMASMLFELQFLPLQIRTIVLIFTLTLNRQ